MPLKLISNTGKLNHDLIGSVYYKLGKIHITLNPYCQATLLRDDRNVSLLKTADQKSSIVGMLKEGDIYTLKNNNDTLIIRVEKFDTFSKFIKILKFPKRKFIVRDRSDDEAVPQAKKTTLTVGVLLLVLLLTSVFFGIRQKKIKDFKQKNEKLLTQALSDYQSSVDSFPVDKGKSRELFASSKEIAKKLEKDGYKNEVLENLLKDITAQEGEVMGEIKTSLKEFLDLTLQTSDFDGAQMVSSGEDIFVLDDKNKNIVKVGLKTRRAEITAGSSMVENTIQIGAYQERLFLLKDNGIYEINNSSHKVLETNTQNILFYLYAGNIYLLDKSNNKISRYVGIEGGFGSESDWLAPGIEADFSKIKDMTIDGSIWTLSSSGKVSKFTLGSPQSISLNGLIGQLTNPTAIYTNENLKYVYVLERDKGRIIVLEKNGDFKVQYVSDDVKNAKDLIVSEGLPAGEAGKIILLTGPKLMYIDLK